MATKRITEEAIKSTDKIGKLFENNAKEILKSTLFNGVKNYVNEGLDDIEDEETSTDSEGGEETTDTEVTVASDDMGAEATGDEDDAEGSTEDAFGGSADEEGEDDSVEAGIDADMTGDVDADAGDGLGDDFGGDDVTDLTGASDEELVKVFKEMKPEDGVVVQKDGENITLQTPEAEYVIKTGGSSMPTGTAPVGGEELDDLGGDMGDDLGADAGAEDLGGDTFGDEAGMDAGVEGDDLDDDTLNKGGSLGLNEAEIREFAAVLREMGVKTNEIAGMLDAEMVNLFKSAKAEALAEAKMTKAPKVGKGAGKVGHGSKKFVKEGDAELNEKKMTIAPKMGKGVKAGHGSKKFVKEAEATTPKHPTAQPGQEKLGKKAGLKETDITEDELKSLEEELAKLEGGTTASTTGKGEKVKGVAMKEGPARTHGVLRKAPNAKLVDQGTVDNASSRMRPKAELNEGRELITKVKLYEAEVKKFRDREEDWKGALKVFKDKLHEVAIFNSNLAYATKLFTEHATTKAEKMAILKRFDSAKSLQESKNLYETISKELKSSVIAESKNVDAKINKTPQSAASNLLVESKLYEDPQLKRSLDIMKKLIK